MWNLIRFYEWWKFLFVYADMQICTYTTQKLIPVVFKVSNLTCLVLTNSHKIKFEVVNLMALNVATGTAAVSCCNSHKILNLFQWSAQQDNHSQPAKMRCQSIENQLFSFGKTCSNFLRRWVSYKKHPNHFDWFSLEFQFTFLVGRSKQTKSTPFLKCAKFNRKFKNTKKKQKHRNTQ